MRILNRFLSALLALVLIASGAWALTTSVADATGLQRLLPPVFEMITLAIQRAATAFVGVSMASPIALGIWGALLVIGLLLLIIELRPWPPKHVELIREDGVTWWADRGSVERGLSRLLLRRTSAIRARTRVRARKTKWQVTVDAEAAPQDRDELVHQARSAMERLGQADNALELRVRVHPARRVA